MLRRRLIELSAYTYSSVSSPGNLAFSRGLKDVIKVSESDPVSSEDITKHLNEHSMTYKTGHACLRTTCPKFTRPKLKIDKLDQLYINSTTGAIFICFCTYCI